jgi:accessory gene regulator protein AgrB
MLVAVSVLSSLTLVDRVVYLAAGAEACALHLKGSVACAVTRLAMLVAVSVLSVVITEMQGNGRLKSTLKVLDSTTLVDPSGVY